MADYHVGDVVTIREWDDMAAEFGGAGTINCQFGFTEAMRHFCGNQYEIEEITSHGVYRLKDGGDFSFSTQMFEKGNEEFDYDNSELIEFLNSFQQVGQ